MRLYQNYGIHILETLFEENHENQTVLQRLLGELDLRKTPRAQCLRGQVAERLRELALAKTPIVQPSQAELAALLARLESAVEVQRHLRELGLDAEAARLEELLRQQLVRLRRGRASVPAAPVTPATTPVPSPQPQTDITELVERGIELIRQRGPLFFIQIRDELLRGPGQAMREMPLRLALRLDPRLTCNDRDRWSLIEQVRPKPPTTSSLSLEQQIIQRLREAQRPLLQENFRDLHSDDLRNAVESSHRLIWAFVPVVRILMLSEWGEQGFMQAARMCWDTLRGALLTGMKLNLTRDEWKAIMGVAEARQDLPMLSRAKNYFEP